jgi:hypothetical protein
MSQRFTLLPDPRFAGLRNALEERVLAGADAITPEALPDVLDPTMRATLHNAFAAAGAPDGLVWLLDGAREHLVPAYGVGPNSTALVGTFRQPLSSHPLIGMVLASEQPFCENEVYRNAGQDKTVDRKLGMLTCAMVAVPFYYGRRIRGVISCVQMKPAAGDLPDPAGFSLDDLAHVQHAALVVSRLLDHWLIGVSVGWQPE